MKRVAYIGCLGLVGLMTTEFGIVGILPQIATHYEITIDRAGALLSAFALVIALTGPFMTLFAAGFDRKKIMLMSISVFLFTGIVSSLSPPFWLLMTVRLMPAFLQPVYISTAIAAAIATAPKKDTHKMMAIVMGGTPIATVATIPVATYLASILSWQASFVIQAIVSFIALMFIYWGLPAMPVKERKSYGDQFKILRSKRFLISCIMNFLMVAAWFSTYSYFADYLGRVKMMDAKMISYIMLLFGTAGVAGNWIAGKLLSKSVPFATAIFLTGSVLLPLGLEYAGQDKMIILFIVMLWGFSYGPAFLTASAYLISAAPNALEFANSLSTSFGNLGVTIGTTVSGFFIFSNGIVFAPWVGAAFGLASLAMIGIRTILEANVARIGTEGGQTKERTQPPVA